MLNNLARSIFPFSLLLAQYFLPLFKLVDPGLVERGAKHRDRFLELLELMRLMIVRAFLPD